MELLGQFFDVVLHLDRHLAWLAQNYGLYIYAILFAIIFCETGLVVAPFLPGDSLLFVAGALAAIGQMEVHAVFAVLVCASFLGDNTNYWVGRFLGPRVFRPGSRVFNRGYLDRTRGFYERHGGKTIVIARFMPIIRTFAPFVAGVGHMVYPRFMGFSFAGSVFWIAFFVYGGYFFGNIPFVKQNLGAFILGIVLVSVLPGIVTWLRERRTSPPR
jgi:membrane-associated protein